MDVSLRTLSDRAVLVHGATGVVGQALLAQLGQAGARVGVAVRRPWQVQSVEQALITAGVRPERQLVGVVDSEDAEAASGLVKGVEDSLGPIVALVSAAGAFAHARFGEENTTLAGELWRANFASVHTLARAVVQPMRRRGSGVVVFTGARAATEPPRPGLSLYLASKAALHAYAASLAIEMQAAGVRVAVLAPGIIDSETNRRAMPDVDRGAWASPETIARRLLELAVAPPPAEMPVVVCP